MTANGPKVLLFDIETAPLLAYVWGLWENNVSLNQIHTDWYVLSWAAKWLKSAEIMQADQRRAPDIEDDSRILKRLWKLLDQADIVITQNGKAFDVKKLNARFIAHGFQPPSSYRHIDTRQIAKKHFGFTSTKLEYMANHLGLEQKKSRHSRYTGFELWKACLAGDKEAWAEMADYNIQDVLVLEELFWKLQPWDSGIDFGIYYDHPQHVCRCGSREFKKQGFCFTSAGKYQRYKCKACGAESRDRANLLEKEKRQRLLVPVRDK